MPFTEQQKADIRKFMGMPVAGLFRSSPVGGSLANAGAGWRWNQAWGQLEFRMNNMMPTEEAQVFGTATAGIALIGPLLNSSGLPVPVNGDTITVTFSGGPFISPDIIVTTASNDNMLSFIGRVASNVNLDATCQTVGLTSLAPFGSGSFAQIGVAGANPVGNLNVPVPQAMFTCPSAFTIAVTFTGACSAVVTSQGVVQGPVAPVDWTQVPYGNVTGYVPILKSLEGSWLGSTRNLDTSEADVWRRSILEKKDRWALFCEMRRYFADFLFGVDNGVGNGIIGASGGAFRGTGGMSAGV